MKTYTLLTFALALSASTSAQQLLVNDGFAGLFVESDAPSPLYPGGAAALPGPSNAYPHFAFLPPVPALVPTGAVSIDSTTGATWYTDGVTIATTPNSRYAGPPPVPPFPIPPLLGGPLTGMALDPVAGILWITDGVGIAGITPAPPGLPIVPPFAIAAPTGPLTGLEWDPITGTLWACDLFGAAYNFAPITGALVGPVIPPGAAPAPVTGITVDKTGTAPLGVRSVFLCGPGIIVDVMTGAAAPSFAGMEVGMTFHPAPSIAPFAGAAACPCPSPGYAVGQGLLGPSTTGNPAFGVDVTGLPPGTIAIMAFDFAPVAAPVLVNGIGCPFQLNFGSAIGFGVLSDPFGTASFPFSLAGYPPGLTMYIQNVYYCPADPVLGIGITPVNQVVISAP